MTTLTQQDLMSQLSAAKMADLFNAAAVNVDGVSTVNRFSDRETGERRLKAILEAAGLVLAEGPDSTVVLAPVDAPEAGADGQGLEDAPERTGSGEQVDDAPVSNEVGAQDTPDVPTGDDAEDQTTASPGAQEPVVADAPKSRKRGFRFVFPLKKEIVAHRPNTKRALTVELLGREPTEDHPGGATLQEVMEATGWTEKDAYEGIRLVHFYLGYGMKQDASGRVFLVRPAAK